jgi:hypothetical protein
VSAWWGIDAQVEVKKEPKVKQEPQVKKEPLVKQEAPADSKHSWSKACTCHIDQVGVKLEPILATAPKVLASKPKVLPKKKPRTEMLALLDKPVELSSEDEQVPAAPEPNANADWHLAHSIALVGSDDEDIPDIEAGCKTHNT